MYLVLTDRNEDFARLKLTLGKGLKQVRDSKELWDFLSHDEDESCPLVLIGSTIDIPEALAIAEELRISYPTIGVVLIATKLDTQFIAQALKSGVREVVLASDPESIVLACKKSEEISRRQKKSFSGATHVQRSGKVVLIHSAKAGVGVTTVSSNLAAILAADSLTKVCVVESARNMGDLGVRFRIESNKSWQDLVGIQELDEQALNLVMNKTDYGFDLLLSPRASFSDTSISNSEFKSIISFLRHNYDLVLIDSEAEHDIWNQKLITLADQLILVSDTELASLKNLKVLTTEIFTGGVSRDTTLIILNRCDPKSGVNPDDVPSLIDFEVSAFLPFDSDVLRMSNSFHLMNEAKPRSKFIQELNNFAKLLKSRLDGVNKVAPQNKSRVRKSA